MRKLLTISAVLVVFLGTLSGVLWRQLKAERQLVSEQQTQMTQGTLSEVNSPQLQTSQTAVEASTIPVVAKVSDPMPISREDGHDHQRVPRSAIVPVSPVAATRLEEIHRAEMLQKAEQDSTGKVLAWRDRLAVAGHTLTTAQLQALNAAAIIENRRHTEESFERAANASLPRNHEEKFRAREEELDRMHDTNLRILNRVSPQLTVEQGNALRAQFENGHTTRREAIRVERERAELIMEVPLSAQPLSLPSSR